MAKTGKVLLRPPYRLKEANTPGEAIREIIKAGLITQSALAEMIGIDEGQLSNELNKPGSRLNTVLHWVEIILTEIHEAHPGDADMWIQYWWERLEKKSDEKPQPDPGPDHRADVGLPQRGISIPQ